MWEEGRHTTFSAFWLSEYWAMRLETAGTRGLHLQMAQGVGWGRMRGGVRGEETYCKS